MLSCKEVTQLLSQAQERKLEFGERMQLTLHLAMCKGCKNYRTQMDFLRTACRRMVGSIKGDER
jgi:hypothetical protein